MKIFDFLKIFNSKNNEESSIREIFDESSKEVDNSEYSNEEINKNCYFKLFEKLDKHIINQKNLELTGEGTCIKWSGSDRYGHVKFKLYESAKNNSEIIWNIGEEKLPSDYRVFVNKIANLFLDFVEKERNDLKKFTFEIIDGSHHPVDARSIAYEVATYNAILNSFDEELHKPDLNKLFKIKIKEPVKWVNYKKKK